MQPADRLAIAVPPGGPAVAPGTLAVLGAMTRLGNRTQHYATRACLDDNEQVIRATGLPGRHLDAWLMPPDLLRRVFMRSSRGCNLAVVEGTWDPDPAGLVLFDRPGCLEPASRILNLARVALIPCRDLPVGHWPRFPSGVDAVILDGLDRPEDFPAWRDAIETLARKPVLGAIDSLPEARMALDRPEESADAMAALARSFLAYANLALLRELTRRGPLPELAEPAVDIQVPRRFRVAYAQDEAFTRYFPDTLETLEALGAELVDFSPLRDERIPDLCDLVILGCGYTERHAEALGANHSLIGALRAFACRGRRIYAEGGGMAYLGQGNRGGWGVPSHRRALAIPIGGAA
ncbi:MAG: cobyrinic acid a,c-diamide synthase [Isosphaeraceae bacterium]